MKKKRLFALLAALIMLAASLSGCGSGSGETTSFSFSDSIDIETIQKLAGKQVTITGYMATLSPISGKYMYLMNMPYQSCPFCVPNTSELANTMAVYAKDGKSFAYTDQAIKVTGTLEVGSFTDEYGYEYNYRIKDAEYEVVDLTSVSEKYALWQSIASDGIVSAVDDMFNFVYFVCQWTDYTSYYIDDSGNKVEFFLYPGDVQMYLESTDTYGYASYMTDDYFPGLIRRVHAISDTDLEDLVTIIQKAAVLKQQAYEQLTSGAYTYLENEDRYLLNESETLINSFYDVYYEFSAWLGRWEL